MTSNACALETLYQFTKCLFINFHENSYKRDLCALSDLYPDNFT